MLRPKLANRKPPPPRRSCTDGSVSDPHSDILSSESMICIRKERPTNIDCLPTDLLFKILLRLPADHLYERARLVCRRWYHIIRSHAFINAQMHGATYGLLLSPLYRNNTLPLYVTADADGRIHTSELNHIFELGVRATCNGLVLELEARDFHLRRLVIVNPAMKQSFDLPPLPTDVTYDMLKYGFACSAASLAYKVIRPAFVRRYEPHAREDFHLDVLTVGFDESWRHIEVHHLPHHLTRRLLDKAPLTSEGFLHWGWWRYCATMDVETEIITLSEAPYQYHESTYYYLSTGRCLSLLVACGDLSWEVWEMKAETGEWRKALLPNVDLGAEECRIQQLAPKDAPRVLKPLGWVKYPHVLAFYFGDNFYGKLRWPCIFYNLDTHQLDSIELPESYTRGCQAFPHKNNLIWLS